ncbi:hypothetical protein SDC9_174501 [bioreactor metagenome]|uniref:Uncharacterized protein n=1 Tax=bioreactor metagenome TaxID=1076179 RepID=A0A645GSU1_9ZZZZ
MLQELEYYRGRNAVRKIADEDIESGEGDLHGIPPYQPHGRECGGHVICQGGIKLYACDIPGS